MTNGEAKGFKLAVEDWGDRDGSNIVVDVCTLGTPDPLEKVTLVRAFTSELGAEVIFMFVLGNKQSDIGARRVESN